MNILNTIRQEVDDRRVKLQFLASDDNNFYLGAELEFGVEGKGKVKGKALLSFLYFIM